MAIRREPVNLHFDTGSFTGRLALIDAAVTEIHRREALSTATWEPHDWSDFDA